MTTPELPDALLHAALAHERRRSLEGLHLIRLLAVSTFLVLNLLLAHVLDYPEWRQLRLVFAGLWVTASVVFYLGRERAYAPLSVPLFDVPMVFLLGWQMVRNYSEPEGPALLVLAVYVFLVPLAGLALERRFTVLTALAAVLCAAALQWIAGVPGYVTVLSVLLLGVSGLSTSYASDRALRLVREVAAQEVRRERLGRFFAPEVAAQIDARGDEIGRGASCEVTILFSDLRGFSTLSHALPGATVVDLLNAYYERMVDAVFAHGGTLDKYTGDGLLVYFGAPVPAPDHAIRGVRCAIAMQQALAGLNTERTSRGEEALRMGIGLHSGTVIVGAVGAARRREYTIVGDAVNVAARLQELTRTLDAPILASQATALACGDRQAFAPAGTHRLRGFDQPVECHVPASC